LSQNGITPSAGGIPKEEGFPILWEDRSADLWVADTLSQARESVSNMWNNAAGVPTPAGEPRDSRPPSVRSQDAAIWEYAARNRLLRGRGTPADMPGGPQTPAASRSGWTRRRPGRGAPRTAVMAEGLYHRIAPPGQKYPLRAVAIIRRLLQEGAPEEFVPGKYRMHARACGDIGVAPMPFIPYLAELLEVFLLEAKAARRGNMAPRRPMP